MMYCTACDDEYMPHVRVCGVCGAELVRGEELIARQRAAGPAAPKRVLRPGDDVVAVFQGDQGEARRLEQLLAGKGVSALVAGEGPACGKGCCGGAKAEILVHREDARLALSLIEEDFAATTCLAEHGEVNDTGFDPAAGEHQCPACGHVFPTTTSTCPDCGLCFG